jgi:PIN domain nuclease of toxin-antitoxin system
MQFHNDPFDALIVASAKAVNLPLVTRDAAIQDSGVVKVIW